jgi:hypothetical protein
MHEGRGMGGARAVPRRPREGGANPPFTFPPWANIQEFFSSSATYIVSIPTIRGVVRLIFTHLVCLCVYNASHVGLFGKGPPLPFYILHSVRLHWTFDTASEISCVYKVLKLA